MKKLQYIFSLVFSVAVFFPLKAEIDSLAFDKLLVGLDSAAARRNPEMSDELFDQCLEFIRAKKYAQGLAGLTNLIDRNYLGKSNYESSLECYFKMVKVAEQVGSLTEKAAILNAIGIVYWFQGDYKNALRFYEEDLAILRKTNDQKQMAAVLNNMGLIYRQMNEYETAIRYYNKALQLSVQSNDTRGSANAYNNIGVLNMKRGQMLKSLYFFNKSLELRNLIKDSVGIATSLGNIGTICLKINKLQEAESNFLRSYFISKRLNDLEGVKEIGESLSELYTLQGRGIEALKFYKEFISARDSLMNEETKRVAMQKEMEYKFEQEQQKKTIIADVEKRKQRLYTYSSLLILMIVCVFSAVLFKRFNITRKQKHIIELQKQVVEEKNKEILDSIHYARRIQSSLLPSEKFIEKAMKRRS